MAAGPRLPLQARACDAPRGVRWGFLAALAIYTLVGAVLFGRWQGRFGQPVAAAGFGYGPLIEAIERTGVYRVAPGVHYPGVAFSAHRLPFIPYFLIGLQGLAGNDLGRIGLLKDAVFNGLLAAGCWIVLARSAAPLGWVLGALAGTFTMPLWALDLFEVSVEEAYLIGALALLFALLWFAAPPEKPGARLGWGLGVGLVLVLLLFLKNSLLYWSMAAPAFLWLRGRDWRPALAAWIPVAAGLLGLAAFNRVHSGRFTVGSSWEGWNLYKGNCEFTRDLYPPYSLDNLDYEGKVQADRPLRDEWDYNAYFEARAVAFIRSHPGEFADLALRKAWVFFGEVRNTGLNPGQKPLDSPRYWLQLAWMVPFRLLLWWALADAAVRLGRSRSPAAGEGVPLGYLAFLLLYAGFYVVGFAYERHVMPIVLPTVFYLLWSLAARPGPLAARFLLP